MGFLKRIFSSRKKEKSQIRTQATFGNSVDKGSSGQDHESNPQKSKHPILAHVLHEFRDISDIVHRHFPQLQLDLMYFGDLVANEELNRDVITPLNNIQLDEVDKLLQQSQFKKIIDRKQIVTDILDGHAAIFYGNDVYLINVYGPAARNIQQTEQESVITGPHDAFIESAGTNISLIRRRIKSSHLKSIKLSVGEVTKTDVYLLYLEDIVNMDMVEEIKKRIQAIETASVLDAHILVQYIDEFPNSIFPQFLTTERPDLVASKLIDGKLIGIVNNSPSAFVAPTGLFDFFSSPDDYYQRWPLGTATRLLRFLGFILTITFTALYVSVTTFHYEMVPESLLLNLTESRSRVPFPPIYEALIMEVLIELLREAGARLPSKIGQTIGIVGGIVIGQAAVQAGLTSNILIITVATSAIASFSIPSYIMSASIRLIRIGLIILAGMFGNFGLVFGIGLVCIHLAKLTSIGTSYIEPLAPMFIKEWKDTFIRGPLWAKSKRPGQAITANKIMQKQRK